MGETDYRVGIGSIILPHAVIFRHRIITLIINTATRRRTDTSRSTSYTTAIVLSHSRIDTRYT